MAEVENPPTFPVKIKRNTSSDPLATPREYQMEGMSLRDWFAGQALAGLCANPQYLDLLGIRTIRNAEIALAQVCDSIAGAMLAARKDHNNE